MPAPSMWSMRVIEAILDSKGERRFRAEVERQRRTDRAAMRDGDDVAPGICLEQLIDGPRHPR